MDLYRNGKNAEKDPWLGNQVRGKNLLKPNSGSLLTLRFHAINAINAAIAAPKAAYGHHAARADEVGCPPLALVYVSDALASA